MKKLPLSLLIGAALLSSSAFAAEKNRAISYLTSWNSYPDNSSAILALSKADTFLLSFGQWDSEGNIQISDGMATIPAYDGYWMPQVYLSWTQLKQAHPEKKMMVAFGGQTYEGIWSHLATAAGREKVAQSLVNLLNKPFPVYKKNLKPEEMEGECQGSAWNGDCDMKQYQRAGTVYLDGIDFDFEKAARLTEKENDDLLQLSQRVRALLGPNSKKLLSLTTYHVGADPVECADKNVIDHCSYVENSRSSHHGEVLPLLSKSKDIYDFFNVMAYDAGRNFKYKVAMDNYARAVGDASKIVLGATINHQWAPDGNFVESRGNNIDRAEWQAANKYGGFFVWTLGHTTVQMNLEDQIEYINEMKAAADSVVTDPVDDIIPPTAPANLQATVQGGNILLNWQRAEDNIGVVSYRVYRDGINMESVTATSWQDSRAYPGLKYSYTVFAVDAAGNISPASNRVEAAIPVIIPTPDPIPDPTPEPIPDPIPDPTPEPIPDPTPDPTPEPIPDPNIKDWQVGVNYKAGDEVIFNGKKYQCRQAHSSMGHWDPASVLSLWLPIE